MIHALTTKLEVDVMQQAEIGPAFELATKHKFPAIILHQDLAVQAALARIKYQVHSKIIVPIDWPKGNNRGMNKFRHLPLAAMSQDGYEIMFGDYKTPGEFQADLAGIVEFIRTNLSQLAEIRVVLDISNKAENIVAEMCKKMIHVPGVDFIRTESRTKLLQCHASPKAHNKVIQSITSNIAKPIKLSGNINLKTIESCRAARYGVSLHQCESIISELRERQKAKAAV